MDAKKGVPNGQYDGVILAAKNLNKKSHMEIKVSSDIYRSLNAIKEVLRKSPALIGKTFMVTMIDFHTLGIQRRA